MRAFVPTSGLVLVLLAGLSSPALSQYNDDWLHLAQSTTSLSDGAGGTADLVGNTDQKDFAVADVNLDGWQDVAVGKKVPASFTGARQGRFFLNQKGVLVDRTAQYASASLTPGDLGFQQPLDCRDVEFGDLDGNGWSDFVSIQCDLQNNVTAAAKVVTHPRVYVNLATDASGNWLGFVHDDARVPQLLTSTGTNGTVRFGDGALGDMDLDGDLDLYCTDFDTDMNGHVEFSALDLNHRLLANDGFGYFTDVTTVNLGLPAFWMLQHGTECAFSDVNGDGRPDIVRVVPFMQPVVDVLYNDLGPTAPNFTGGYDTRQVVESSQTYTMALGDLNQDGRIDAMLGDDLVDRMRFNLGNAPSGAVNWSSTVNFAWLTGSGDVGFAGKMYARDFDNDGWVDCLATDFDFELAGCNRRTQMRHNRGGTPGGTDIVMLEEKEMAGTAGWFGAVGWSNAYPKGVFDAAPFDLDNDGDVDIVLGRCLGTDVWKNQTDPVVCQPTVQPPTAGDMTIALCGAPLWSNLTSTLSIADGPPGGIAVTVIALSSSTVPAFGGRVLSPMVPTLTLPIPLDGNGGAQVTLVGGGATPAGVLVYLQVVAGYPAEVSNVLAVTVYG